MTDKDAEQVQGILDELSLTPAEQEWVRALFMACVLEAPNRRHLAAERVGRFADVPIGGALVRMYGGELVKV